MGLSKLLVNSLVTKPLLYLHGKYQSSEGPFLLPFF